MAKSGLCFGPNTVKNLSIKTLKLNSAEILIKPNSFNYKKLHKGLEYEGNEFIIKFNGQQNWFK